MHFSIFEVPDVSELSNVEARNQDGDTPLLQVVKEYLRAMALTDADEDNTVRTIDGLTDTLVERLDVLVHKNANLNAQDRSFKTALILLASSPHSLKAIRYLVEAGASTIYISGGGWDCIDDAIHYGNMATAAYLREAKRRECLARDKSYRTSTSEAKNAKRWTTFWNFF
jgi:ankyrin repeat protein